MQSGASFAACVIAMAVPAVAQAAPKSYLLAHPKREHCRAHYVKKLERVKKREHGKTTYVKETFCVYRAPTPASTPEEAAAPAPATPSKIATVTIGFVANTYGKPGPYHLQVSGVVSAIGGHDLIGEPILYKLENSSTGQVLTTFTEPSNPTFPCAIVPQFEEPTQTFTGEAFGQEPACFAGRFQAPTGQYVRVVASYAGSETYEPSTSSEPPTL